MTSWPIGEIRYVQLWAHGRPIPDNAEVTPDIGVHSQYSVLIQFIDVPNEEPSE
jgi:hypothetical protein